MKSIIYTSIFIASATLLSSCNNSEKKSIEEAKKVTYSYNHDDSFMEWTSYKFERKAPVKGTFKKMTVSSLTEASTVKEMAESFGFTIPVNSIETQDESRNAKIIEFFFGAMSTTELTGRILKLNDDGSAELEVKMHGITDVVKGTYEIADNNFSFKATMDVSKWDANKAIATLNEACGANHTENGVTKLWPEVDLSFTTKLVENH